MYCYSTGVSDDALWISIFKVVQQFSPIIGFGLYQSHIHTWLEKCYFYFLFCAISRYAQHIIMDPALEHMCCSSACKSDELQLGSFPYVGLVNIQLN